MSIKIFIADDQELLSSALATILSSQEGLHVFGTGNSGRSAVTHAHMADLVLLDVRMPDMDGITALREIKAMDNPPKVIMLTTYNSPNAVEESIAAGADGFLLKDADPSYLIEAVRSVASGNAVLSSGVTSTVLESWRKTLTTDSYSTSQSPISEPVRQGLALLTPREICIFKLVAEGLSNQEIADKLYISITTVKSHISSLLTKLHARDRVALVIIAHKTGFVET